MGKKRTEMNQKGRQEKNQGRLFCRSQNKVKCTKLLRKVRAEKYLLDLAFQIHSC